MEEYEVDLRDYLRVIWEQKWVILGVFVVAVVAAAVFSFSLPDEYDAKALLQLEGPPLPVATGLEAPDNRVVKQLLQSASPEIRISDVSSNLLMLTLRGSVSSQELARRLSEVINTTQKFLQEQTRDDLDQQIAFLQEIDQQEERQLLERQLALKQQLQLLLEARESSDVLDLAAQAQMISLMSELQALYAQRSDTRRTLAALKQLSDASWSPLRLVQGPQGSSAPVGPSRRLNVAIAGVLGLFVGLLLAFFLHYLQSTPFDSKPREHSEADRPSPA